MRASFLAMVNAISLSSLSYSVSDSKIVNALNLEISDNEYFAIAGLNGAGKSTLIKLVLDLIRPSEASDIKIFGRSNRLPEVRERIAYLPEKFEAKRTVTGWQYLKFITSIYSLLLDERVAVELAEKLDFPVERFDSRLGSYSKGMLQKLGLVSCFILNRKLLILDEPLSGLDPKARFHFKELLLEKKREGLTILYSTHMLADVEELCDNFGILHGGNLKFVGTPEACRQVYGGDTLEQAYINCIDG